MEYRILGKTGLRVSTLALGGAPLGGNYGGITVEGAGRTVRAALDAGINFIDVAPYYGITLAETNLGHALRGIPRDRYVISTKVGRYGMAEFDFSARRVTESVEESLARLGLDEVDILIVHDIEFTDIGRVIEETLPALERVRQAGKFRYLGVSGLPLKIFGRVLPEYPLDLILSYCHYSLNDTSLERILPLVEEQELGMILASPLSMGLLTEAGPPDWHPAGPEIREKCAEAARFARSRGVDVAEMALAFSLANPRVHTVLVGMKSETEVARNVSALEYRMDPEVLAGVRQILAPVQDKTWPSGLPENNS